MAPHRADFGAILARLARSTVIEDGNLADVLAAITETAAVALDVERANIWVFDGARTHLRCIEAYERSVSRHTSGDEILAAVAPAYLAALESLRTVAAFDALDDPRTRELAGYLQPRGITTLLDAPLYLAGAVGGVVCHEHVGPVRRWSVEEQAFAGSVGDLVSLAMEADRRIRAERALREGEELFRAVGDRFHEAMFLVDARDPSSLAVRYANEAACHLSGYGRAELIDRPVTILADPGARVALDEQLGRALRGEITLFDSLQRRKDGSVIPVEIYARGIDCAGRPTLLLLGRDMSHRVHTERAQLEFQADVLKAQRRESLGILAGGIAHEFSNLMMAILGGASLALVRMPDPSPARDHIAQVERAARRATDLCHRLQAFAGGARCVMEWVDLSVLVDEVLRLMRTIVPGHLTVERDLTGALPVIAADVGQIRMVVVSLITNAVEAIGGSPGTVAVRTRVGRFTQADFQDAAGAWQTPDGEYVCLEVEDSGPGMSEETRRRILEPSYPARAAGRELGLAAVHGIVCAHRGALGVTSEPGRGTLIRVFLPLRAASSVLPPTEAWRAHADTSSAPPPRETILVVDDEPLVREVAALALAGEGFAVIPARNGREARELIDSRDDIAVVVLDLGLPDIGGAELLHAIRERRPGLPVIVSSGHDEQIASGRDVPIGPILRKPWELSQFVTAVKQALATRS